ncbi:MAG TPA: hypothetical protein VF070_14685 [Streptosporangiaceae bacterium]
MRRSITILIAGIFVILTAALPARAAERVIPPITQPTEYLCDGNGVGDCKSLPPHGSVVDGARIFAVARNSGAWRWDVFPDGLVENNFTYPPLNNQLNGQTIWVLKLHANNNFCNGNSGGADILKDCSNQVFPPSEQWVLDPSNHYFVNIGRSNDKDNWEVLCNPGGGGPLVIGTRDSCTTYHEQWNFVS